jgi:hypothetical protein
LGIGNKLRSNYWSIGKFADWLRGTPKPHWGTGDDWNDWEKQARSARPVRYWIAEEGLDRLQQFVYYIPDKLNDLRYYINNRWVTRTHALTAHPRDIKPGSWSDVGNRFLPCLFNELANFVEIEQAWHYLMWDSEEQKKYNVPWWRSGWLRWRTWRCPAAGMEYLAWASGLVINEDIGVEPGSEGYGEPTSQAKAAKEIIELYTWWTVTYRNRPDPYEASGWNAYCDASREENGSGWLHVESHSPALRKQSDKAHQALRKIEADYEKEDEDMMIRLIKIRQGLWT